MLVVSRTLIDEGTSVAVGTPVTRRPLHRSRRAVFPHRALQTYALAQKYSSSRKDP